MIKAIDEQVSKVLTKVTVIKTSDMSLKGINGKIFLKQIFIDCEGQLMWSDNVGMHPSTKAFW